MDSIVNGASFICVYALVSTIAVSGQPDYFVNSTKAAWDTAVTSCTLATPAIKFSPERNTVDIELPGLNVTVPDEFWLGYIMTYNIFQYIGCAKSNYIKSIAEEIYTKWLNLELCFSACKNTEYIGLRTTEGKYVCYCVNSLLNLTEARETECKQQCNFTRGILCGGDNFVSLYEIVPDLSVDNISSGKGLYDDDCIVYDASTGVFRWFTCDTYYEENFSMLCQTDNGTIIIDHLLVANWIDAVKRCFRTNYFPATYHYISSMKFKEQFKNSNNMWTSMFRSLAINKYTGQAKKEIQKFCYLDTVFNTGVMFTESSTELYKSVCQNETIRPTSPTTTEIATRYTEPTTRSTTESIEQLADDNAKHYIYIVVAVGGLLVIVIIITVVVIVRKRRKSVRKNDNETNQNDIPLAGPSDGVYAEAEYAEADYTDIPPTTKGNAIAVENSTSNNANDDVYDTANMNKGSIQGKIHMSEKTDNIYNTFNDVSDNIYNCTDSSKVRNRTGCTLPTKQSHTGNNAVSGGEHDICENMYSHLDVHAIQSNKAITFNGENAAGGTRDIITTQSDNDNTSAHATFDKRIDTASEYDTTVSVKLIAPTDNEYAQVVRLS